VPVKRRTRGLGDGLSRSLGFTLGLASCASRRQRIQVTQLLVQGKSLEEYGIWGETLACMVLIEHYGRGWPGECMSAAALIF